ncbi:hypothetical protein ACWGCF_45110, partial [Streptomyces sp. NPDC055039]
MTMLVAGTLFFVSGVEGHAGEAATGAAATTADVKAIAAAAGATTPFVTVEAESGSLGGGAVVRS